jgi:Rho termination factor, N-terminal domain
MGLSLEELNKKASELNVPRRDTMNKEQLILAIRSRLSGTEV